MTVTTTYPRIGQVEDGYEQYIDTVVADTVVMTAGQVGCYVGGELVVAPIDDTGVRPFQLIVEDKAAGILQARVLTFGIGYCLADASIAIGTSLKAGTTVAGRLMQATEGGTPTTLNKRAGDYMGHPGEGSGNSPITAATVGQIIKVFFK